MPDLWLPGATRVPGNNGLRAGAGGGLDKDIFTWHSFEAPYTFSPDCIAAARYLNVQGSTSTFCLHPITGAIAQMLPANQAARTLRVTDPRTGEFADVNRYGRTHMQVEVIAYARRPFTLDLTRAGLDALTTLMNFLRSHGVKDQWAWPGQPPPLYPGGSVRRRLPEQSGHAYHSGWPVNDHGDPGAIAAPWLLIDQAQTDHLYGFDADHWRWVQGCLTALGYYTGRVDGGPAEATLEALRRYQRDRRITRDGLPGPITTTHLEDDMATIDDVLREVTTVTLSPADYRTIYGREVDGPQVVRQDDADRLTWRRVYDTLRHTRSIEATLAAQGQVLEQLAQGQGIDPAQVRDAVAAAVRDGLDDVAAEVRDALLAEGVADSVAARVVARVGSLLTATNQEG